MLTGVHTGNGGPLVVHHDMKMYCHLFQRTIDPTHLRLPTPGIHSGSSWLTYLNNLTAAAGSLNVNSESLVGRGPCSPVTANGTAQVLEATQALPDSLSGNKALLPRRVH